MSLERSIAIDGPAGSGKSTVARMLAAALGYRYVSTGDLYRALALEVLRRGVDPYDEGSVVKVAQSMSVRVEPVADGAQRTLVGGEDVSSLIRSAQVESIVSPVSVYPAVRVHMVQLQRAMAVDADVVMDGRDIGAVVLAESRCKFFLTASARERARRRQRDHAAQGRQVALDEVQAEIAQRDTIDSTRPVSPLTVAPDAIVIDCTAMSPTEVVGRMLQVLGRSNACSTPSSERS
ncbi:MAG TPA: (d)CMP kinase [Firmicutes bacterium]|nr:(d)CMP kinase [Bacillota bacterium]